MIHRLRFFDCNCMVGRSPIYEPQPMRLETRDQLVREMGDHGIQEAIVYSATTKEQLGEWRPPSDDIVLEWTDGEPRLHPAAVLNLHHTMSMPEPEEDIAQMVGRGIRMAVIFPTASYPYLVNEWLCGGLLSALEAHRVPVLLQNSALASRWPQFERVYGFSVENIDWMCERYPNLPIILGGVASHSRVLSPLMKRRSNLYIELSKCFIHQPIRFFSEHVGIERVLFGSGLPFTGPGPAMTEVHYGQVSEEAKLLVAGDNLRRLLAEVK
ncbi:MAG: amidohydrolase family protein [Chloroflexota bacterium]